MAKDHRMTDEEKAQIKSLMALGFSPTAIGKKLDRDHKTVIAYTRKPETIAEIAELKEDLADAYEGLARRMVDSISDEDIQKINAYQRTVASGIATDKARLLRGQSTESIDLSISGLIAKITKNARGLLGADPVEEPTVIDAECKRINDEQP